MKKSIYALLIGIMRSRNLVAKTEDPVFIKAPKTSAFPPQLSCVGVVFLIATAMIGCKSQEVITNSESLTYKENKLEYERDSIVIRDSVRIFVHGDTVFQDRFCTKLKTRYISRKDTVYSTNTVVEKQVVEKKVIPRWVWWVTGYGLLITGLVLIGIILKIKRIF